MLASMLHLVCIWGGPDWYLAMGAGQAMADMAAAGDLYPTLVTAFIAVVLALWGVYAFSGAGAIIKLLFLKTVLVLITSVYLLRGVAGLFAPFVTTSPMIQQNSITFWLVSSLICCVYGAFYLLGTSRLWGKNTHS
ncbi:hypothetical protein CWB99_20855 [Pseudoalteromonas rubra]|uniref:Uncharacterized protein n=1 Tax=Pseudoalteromonas rubra TaxID=43658 RepID=A0A5S3WGD3_9GAMM|nr:hypothetical protein [Pseudoalteromonas rubra]TMP25619.1 hypothetical protein CWB99_20855 [Pseudoalteromonas rubra]TMP30968.1 hypothetical protein CWC00_15280 [Pseudoalteromonas rubra]